MRVTVLTERRNVLRQHAADFLKIFLPIVAEIVRKPGDEMLKRIHFCAGQMTLRDAGRVARYPYRSHAFCSGPEFDESGLRIEPRLDGVKRERVKRKLAPKKSILKDASAAALHEFKSRSSVVAF